MALRLLMIFALGAPSLLWAQAEYRVYNDHPRLFLDADRLKRLARDAARETDRWKRLRQQVDSGASMPERAVALALASQLEGDEAACEQAVELVRGADLSGPHPLRQSALVLDWCYGSIDEQTRLSLASRLFTAAQSAPATAEGARDAAMALIAVSGDADGSEAVLGQVLRSSWESNLLPELKKGGLVDRGTSLVALLELAHVLRYNLDRDLWDEAPEAFRALPEARILGYLPQVIESPEGKLRRYAVTDGDPIEEAVLGRIAEMLLVGYENSSRPAQFLQGWLRNDTYTLKGPYGALYEFLWINPYLPGLAPASAPKWTFDPVRSRVFARRDDRWIGYFDHELHVDLGSGLQPAGDAMKQDPLYVEGAAIVWPGDGKKWTLEVPQGSDPHGPVVLLIGLEAGRSLEVRLGKGDWRSFTADRAGVVVVRNDFEAKQTALKYGESVRMQVR